MISAVIAAALMLIAAGCAIAASTRDLVRVLIGLEVMFLGAVISLVPLYQVMPDSACMITLSLFIAAVSETILLIAVLFRVARVRRKVTVPLTGES